jgi:hypothetical protein
MNLATTIAKNVGTDNVTFIGHSLGGGEAAAQAIVTGSNAVVFDAAAVNPYTVGGLLAADGQITDYYVSGDIVTSKANAPFWFEKYINQVQLPAVGAPAYANGTFTFNGQAPAGLFAPITLHGLSYAAYGLLYKATHP